MGYSWCTFAHKSIPEILYGALHYGARMHIYVGFIHIAWVLLERANQFS